MLPGEHGDGKTQGWYRRVSRSLVTGESTRLQYGLANRAVALVAVGALSDGTPVIVSGGRDSTVRVRRLADGTRVGELLRGHAAWVYRVQAVAVGALPDGPVIVSGGDDGTVRIWRLADGAPVVPPLGLPESVWRVAVHGDVIVTATGGDIAVHQPALSRLFCV